MAMAGTRDAGDTMAEALRPSTVLVVDDEALICESLRTYLLNELDHVDVLTASSVDEALALLAEHRVEVVLADHKMPGRTGLELLADVHRRSPSVARILMTAYPDVKLAQAAINQGGVDRFFTKPLDPEEVVATVGELLRDRSHARARRRAFARSFEALRRNPRDKVDEPGHA